MDNMLIMDFAILEDSIRGEGGLDSLEKLHNILREEQILDTARMLMTANLNYNSTSFEFRLNKQAAFAGKASFPADEGVLGSIHVRLHDGSKAYLEKIIDWLAPSTEEGKALFEKPMPE
jgi:hypothetical protein